MSKKVADIIVETLQSAGVRHCCGVVGDTLNLIARSLERSKIAKHLSPHPLNVGLAKQTRETSRSTRVQFAPARQSAKMDVRRQMHGPVRNALSRFD